VSEYDDPIEAVEAEAERQKKLRATRLEVAVRDALKKPYVRILLQELIVQAGYYGYTPKDRDSAQRWAGGRDVALWLRAQIGAVDFDMLSRMEQELAAEIPDPRKPSV
jgi:hypothetical protein